MAKLSLSEVSKQFSIDRSTIYRAVKNGRLSRSSDGSFDISEVIRCFGEPKIKDKSHNDQSSITITDNTTEKLIKNLENEVKKYQEREERLLQQIDRMQTLLELKNVAPTTATQQQDTTARNNHTQQQNNTNQGLAINEPYQDNPLSAIATQQQDTTAQSTVTPQHAMLHSVASPQTKKRGVLNRVLSALFDDD